MQLRKCFLKVLPKASIYNCHQTQCFLVKVENWNLKWIPMSVSAVSLRSKWKTGATRVMQKGVVADDYQRQKDWLLVKPHIHWTAEHCRSYPCTNRWLLQKYLSEKYAQISHIVHYMCPFILYALCGTGAVTLATFFTEGSLIQFPLRRPYWLWVHSGISYKCNLHCNIYFSCVHLFNVQYVWKNSDGTSGKQSNFSSYLQ